MIDAGRVTVLEKPDPHPRPGEALVRIVLAGICGTDLELARGYMDFRGVPGHEFVGIVESVEADAVIRHQWRGRRVAGEINLSCRTCDLCLQGMGRHCPWRTVLGILGKDGAHAGFVTLPIQNLHAVPDSISDPDAVFIEPLAAACEILDQIPVSSDARVLVVGDGRLGQLIARTMRTVADSVTVLGLHRSKLALLEPLGIASTDDARSLGRDYDFVIEASGTPDGFDAALAAIRPRGILVLKSTYHGDRPIPAARLVVDEITLLGSRCGRFEVAIPLLETRAVTVEDLFSEEFPLKEAPAAYARAGAPGVLKVLLRPEP